MIRIHVSAWFLVMGLIVGSPVAAENPVPEQPEPPVRLKKKVKPQPESGPSRAVESPSKKVPIPKKKQSPREHGEPKDTPQPSLQDLQERITELMNRVSKNMTQVEKRLHKQDPGEITQQTQLDIVRDLDKLIEQTRRRQQQQAQSRSSSRLGQATNQSRRQPNRASGGASPSSQNRQAKTPGGNNGRGGRSSQEGTSKIADLYKDVWGHLPEALRQEMNQYAREQFMAKYSDLLKQYYATIAEKGRRKEEP